MQYEKTSTKLSASCLRNAYLPISRHYSTFSIVGSVDAAIMR